MYEKILVPLDGSEPSKHALNHAISIAEGCGSRLILLAVMPNEFLPVMPHYPCGAASITFSENMVGTLEKMKTIYERMLSEAKEMISSEHLDIETEMLLREGRPSSIIVELVENEGVDLIVMGSRGIGGIMGWILGSTSCRVAENCTKPVLILK